MRSERVGRLEPSSDHVAKRIRHVSADQRDLGHDNPFESLAPRPA